MGSPAARRCSNQSTDNPLRQRSCGRPRAQGRGGLYYAGAWAGYGFHEDGLRAGMAVAAKLGAAIPWTPRATSPKATLLDAFFVRTFDRFARAALSIGKLRFILPNGEELVYGGEASAQQHVPAQGVHSTCWTRRSRLLGAAAWGMALKSVYEGFGRPWAS